MDEIEQGRSFIGLNRIGDFTEPAKFLHILRARWGSADDDKIDMISLDECAQLLRMRSEMSMHQILTATADYFVIPFVIWDGVFGAHQGGALRKNRAQIG